MLTAWYQRGRREKIVLKQLDFAAPVTNSADLVRARSNKGSRRALEVIDVSQVGSMTGQIISSVRKPAQWRASEASRQHRGRGACLRARARSSSPT